MVWVFCFWEEANRFDFHFSLSFYHHVCTARRRRVSHPWRTGSMGGGEDGPARNEGRGASLTSTGSGRVQALLPAASGRRGGLLWPAAAAPGGLRLLLVIGASSTAEGLVRWLVVAGDSSVVVAAEVEALVCCRVPAVDTRLRRWRRFSSRGVMGKMC
jgi:hypothetical protein